MKGKIFPILVLTMKHSIKKTLKIYWQHIKRYKVSGLIVFICTVGGALTNTIFPIYFKKFFNILAEPGSKSVIADQLVHLLFIILGLQLIHWGFRRLQSYTNVFFQTRIMADLSNTCFTYIHQHSFAFFTNNYVGSLVKRANRFATAFEALADKVTFMLLPLFVNITTIIIVLTQVNKWLSLVLIAWTIVFIIINFFFIRYKLKYDILRSEADTKMTGVLADTITNNVNVKLFNGYDREVANFSKVNNSARNLRALTWTLSTHFETVQGLLAIALEIGLFYIAIILWTKDLVTIGDFVLIQAYAITVIMEIWDFGRTIQRGYEDLADADEMTQILETPHGIVDQPNAKNLKVKAGQINFSAMDFYYNDTRKIFSKFNLQINPEEKVALVGPSGAGKTTIIKLLLRMYEIGEGDIKIDGQNIAKVTQESLWENIGMVPQDPILFHRSLLENIRYGKPKATAKEAVAAAKLAHCHEFISSFPDGYDTYVGERGVKLSGGERQRVAIARAILRNSPILILDEATSSLDSESENLIQDALNNLIKNKTVIVIAHRLSTIMKMDRIIVVDGGKIIEQGTHDELVERKGIYNKLWSLQAGGFIR